jgi:hypothetical protein
LALVMYCVRYTGYSFITNPWMAFPFEALELFTINLQRIACMQWVGVHAPKGKETYHTLHLSVDFCS